MILLPKRLTIQLTIFKITLSRTNGLAGEKFPLLGYLQRCGANFSYNINLVSVKGITNICDIGSFLSFSIEIWKIYVFHK